MTLHLAHDRVEESTEEPDFYVEDDIYVLLETDRELREAFLIAVKRDDVLVGRTGVKVDEGYILREITVELPEIQTSREVGYYAPL